MAIYKNKIDLHMHTLGSFDAERTAPEMCEAAIENFLATIAITDHFDVDFYEEHNLDERQRLSREGVLSAREKYSDKIRVLRGIELGQPVYDLPLTEKAIERYEYDFVIGSIHNLRNMPDFSNLDYPCG